MLLLNFRRKNIKKTDNFQINQAYKTTCCLQQKTRFSLNITDCMIKIWQKENLQKFPNKPWSARGLDKLINDNDNEFLFRRMNRKKNSYT